MQDDKRVTVETKLVPWIRDAFELWRCKAGFATMAEAIRYLIREKVKDEQNEQKTKN